LVGVKNDHLLNASLLSRACLAAVLGKFFNLFEENDEMTKKPRSRSFLLSTWILFIYAVICTVIAIGIPRFEGTYLIFTYEVLINFSAGLATAFFVAGLIDAVFNNEQRETFETNVREILTSNDPRDPRTLFGSFAERFAGSVFTNLPDFLDEWEGRDESYDNIRKAVLRKLTRWEKPPFYLDDDESFYVRGGKHFKDLLAGPYRSYCNSNIVIAEHPDNAQNPPENQKWIVTNKLIYECRAGANGKIADHIVYKLHRVMVDYVTMTSCKVKAKKPDSSVPDISTNPRWTITDKAIIPQLRENNFNITLRDSTVSTNDDHIQLVDDRDIFKIVNGTIDPTSIGTIPLGQDSTKEIRIKPFVFADENAIVDGTEENLSECDGLIIWIEVNYEIKKNRVLTWRLTHLTKDLDFIIKCPDGHEIECNVFAVYEPAILNVNNAPNVWQFPNDDGWMQPRDGFVYRIVDKSRHNSGQYQGSQQPEITEGTGVPAK